MITLGVDLAAEAARTAVVRIAWTEQGLVTDAISPASDDAIVALATNATKIGIDCPLGWPLPFVDFISTHMQSRVDVPADTIEARRPLVYRSTDSYCQQRGLRPLSVAADRIGHAALRGAGLLTRLGEDDRSGAGLIVEAYPAGSLQIWGLPHRRYKNDPAIFTESIGLLEQRTGLHFANAALRTLCTSSDHAFDAVIAAITARAAAIGATEAVPAEYAAIARREGWIALPTGLPGFDA